MSEGGGVYADSQTMDTEDRSNQLNELFTALAKAQCALQAAPKDKPNPFFKSRYADLAGIWDACRQALADNGLAVIQSPSTTPEGDIVVTTLLGHSSGQWIESRLRLTPIKRDPQAAGSAITYGRRYGLTAMIGVVSDEDDDGNAASQPTDRAGASPAKAPPRPPKPTPPAKKPDTPEAARRRAIYAAITKAGLNSDHVKAGMRDQYGIETTNAIPQDKFQTIMDELVQLAEIGRRLAEAEQV